MVAGSSSLFPQIKICLRDVFTFRASANAQSPLFPMLLNETTRLKDQRITIVSLDLLENFIFKMIEFYLIAIIYIFFNCSLITKTCSMGQIL